MIRLTSPPFASLCASPVIADNATAVTNAATACCYLLLFIIIIISRPKSAGVGVGVVLDVAPVTTGMSRLISNVT